VRGGLGWGHDAHLDTADVHLDAGRVGCLVRRRDDAAGLRPLGRYDGLRLEDVSAGWRRMRGGRRWRLV
jgi:hypothetical protein